MKEFILVALSPGVHKIIKTRDIKEVAQYTEQKNDGSMIHFESDNSLYRFIPGDSLCLKSTDSIERIYRLIEGDK